MNRQKTLLLFKCKQSEIINKYEEGKYNVDAMHKIQNDFEFKFFFIRIYKKTLLTKVITKKNFLLLIIKFKTGVNSNIHIVLKIKIVFKHK